MPKQKQNQAKKADKSRKIDKPPKFHIVVPSFNQAEFIGQTLDSILSQDGVDVRVYVFDGGSTDGTVELLKTYGKKIFWVSEKDRGQTDAINKGVKLILSSDGVEADLERDFFAYLNSDDYYLPGALGIVTGEFAGSPQKSWLVGDCLIVDENGVEIQHKIRAYKNFWRSFLSKSLLTVLNPIPQPAVFMRLQALKAAGEFDANLRYTMDYEYWTRLWRKFGEPINSDRELAGFRIHGSSKGSTSFEDQFAEQLIVAKKLSRNRVLLTLQILHNRLITSVYKLLK